MKKETESKMILALRKHLSELSEEDRIKLAKELSGPYIPEGWVSIEEHLPMMNASDLLTGYTTYTVKNAEGKESTTIVSDHNTWYYYAKEAGITHWLKE